ncbi:mechanosensitive ion channel family protein [Leptospira fluminis]|uniref:Mechanosensitive ion channel family protein n=1 Tax=Leptospira fluminis TaxID=2484979 RepID=A0A4R9GLU6_9LEPT|nr:mechanosensitive ion channel family protein [Leptospira fluminis]TGK15605.1 mechanosensitive ion channel family protein [Leptospira fluminis]
MKEIEWPIFLESHWMIGLSVAIIGILFGYIFGGFLVPKLLQALTEVKLDKKHPLYLALRSLIRYSFFFIGLYVALHALSVPPQFKQHAFLYMKVFAIVVLSFSLAEVAAGFFELFSSRNGGLLSSASILSNILRAAILLLGCLAILQAFGISVAPALTALGVGGLAVALGLQETLSNLFAGLEILLGKKVKVGDFISLETGEEGYIEDINWRSTSLRKLNGSTVIVPNSKMSKTTFTNYKLPSSVIYVNVPVSVSYSNDLPKVEKICIETAESALQAVYGSAPKKKPSVQFQSLGSSNIDLAVTFELKEITDQYLLKSEFIKSLHARFKSEGIEFPTASQNKPK